MAEDNANKSKKSIWIIIICAGVVVIAAALALFQKDKPETVSESIQNGDRQATANITAETDTSRPQNRPQPMKVIPPDADVDQPVVDYGKLEKDDKLRTLMDKRKESYGFEKGVDIIVKPDESVKVGDEVIPMQEILDKIRLKRGEVIEKDIKASGTPESVQAAAAPEKKYEAIEKLIQDKDKSDTVSSGETEKKTEQLISVYKEYKSTEDKIKEKREILDSLKAKQETMGASTPVAPLPTARQKEITESNAKPVLEKADKAPTAAGLASPKQSGPGKAAMPIQKPVTSDKEMAKVENYIKSIQDDINSLLLQKGNLESELKQLLSGRKKPEAYGIYVVQGGDNIWDVHFKFLKEYFTSRGVLLGRTADEPDAKGKSSGVGKILKFSENMVYIYNTRKRRLESNINMIHPLSKIVVFNMGQVFELLDSVAYHNIEYIQFDGENLWLPAEG